MIKQLIAFEEIKSYCLLFRDANELIMVFVASHDLTDHLTYVYRIFIFFCCFVYFCLYIEKLRAVSSTKYHLTHPTQFHDCVNIGI